MGRRKLELTSIGSRAGVPHATVTAIFKVGRPDYVPAGVQVRSRIDATMFTGSFPGEMLPQIELDPLVVSISPAKPLRLID